MGPMGLGVDSMNRVSGYGNLSGDQLLSIFSINAQNKLFIPYFTGLSGYYY